MISKLRNSLILAFYVFIAFLSEVQCSEVPKVPQFEHLGIQDIGRIQSKFGRFLYFPEEKDREGNPVNALNVLAVTEDYINEHPNEKERFNFYLISYVDRFLPTADDPISKGGTGCFIHYIKSKSGRYLYFPTSEEAKSVDDPIKAFAVKEEKNPDPHHQTQDSREYNFLFLLTLTGIHHKDPHNLIYTSIQSKSGINTPPTSGRYLDMGQEPLNSDTVQAPVYSVTEGYIKKHPDGTDGFKFTCFKEEESSLGTTLLTVAEKNFLKMREILKDPISAVGVDDCYYIIQSKSRHFLRLPEIPSVPPLPRVSVLAVSPALTVSEYYLNINENLNIWNPNGNLAVDDFANSFLVRLVKQGAEGKEGYVRLQSIIRPGGYKYIGYYLQLEQKGAYSVFSNSKEPPKEDSFLFKIELLYPGPVSSYPHTVQSKTGFFLDMQPFSEKGDVYVATSSTNPGNPVGNNFRVSLIPAWF